MEHIPVVIDRTVKFFLEYGIRLIDVKFGLEVANISGHGAAVGAATRVDKVEALINNLLAHATPVAFAIAILLGLFGVRVGKAVFGEELGHVFIGRVGLGQLAMRAVIEFVGASHYKNVSVCS